MRNKKVFFAVACVSLILLNLLPVLANETAEKRALEASDMWLKLSDSGRYSESWETAAEFFRNAISKEQWSQSLNAVRKPFGEVIKRTVKSK